MKIPTISKTSKVECPLSFGQERLFYLHVIGAEVAYNMPVGVYLKGNLDKALLKKVFKTLFERHSIFKTVYNNAEGAIYQICNHELSDEEIMKLIEKPEIATFDDAMVLAQKLALEPFNLENSLLFKNYLIAISEKEFVWLLVIHHSIFDGYSQIIFFSELEELYNDSLGHKQYLPIEYKDYAVWQREQLKVVFNEQLDFWKIFLDGSNPARIISDYYPDKGDYLGAREKIQIPKLIANKLNNIAKMIGVSLYTLLLAALKVFLFHFSGETDITVGTVTANRSRPESKEQIKNIIGFFANTIPVRTIFSPELSFFEALKKVGETVKKCVYNNSDVPFEQIVKALKLAGSYDKNPLFNILFVFQNKAYQDLHLKDISCQPLEQGWGTAKFDLALELRESAQGLSGFIEYRTSLYKRETIKNLIEHFCVLIEDIAENPSKKLSELTILNQKDIQMWNDLNISANYRENSTSIISLIKEAALNNPSAVAINYKSSSYLKDSSKDIKLSYKELMFAVDCLSEELFAIIPRFQFSVGICLERSPEMVIALLAILNLRCVAVPLEIRELEENLILHKMNELGLSLIITNKQLLPLIKKISQKAENPCEFFSYTYAYDPEFIFSGLPKAKLSGSTLSYIEYTSGTSGFPKGVPISNKALTNWAAYLRKYVPKYGKKVFISAPLTFDCCIWEILCLSLAQGAELVLNAEAERADPKALQKLFEEEKVEIATLTPSMLKQFSADELSSLNLIFSTGENLTHQVVKDLLASGIVIVNAYGPTEEGIGCTMAEIESGDFDVKPSIGKPIPNTCLYVIDEHKKILPVGALGQIAVGGIGLTKGYINKPQLNEEKFIHLTIANKEERLYLTGDRGRLLPDGNIDIQGRIKNEASQQKINGVRIELENIKLMLCQHSAILNAEVLTIANNKKTSIVCYLVFNSSVEEIEPADLTMFLIKKGLPPQVLPIDYFKVDSIPMTRNGKIDGVSLLKIPLNQKLMSKYYVEAETPLQKEIIEIYKKVLGCSEDVKISIIDHFFFNLGGTSALAARLRGELLEQYGIFPSWDVFYTKPTIETLAGYIEKNQKACEAHQESMVHK